MSSPGSIFKLQTYQQINDNLHLIDVIYGEDQEELKAVGQYRSAENSDYLVLLLTYKLEDASIVTNELNSQTAAT